MRKRAADQQPPGTPTAMGVGVDAEPVPTRDSETPVVHSHEPFVNVTTEAAHVLVETLFAGSHQQIPRVRYAVAYELVEGGSGGDIVDVFHYDNDQVSFSVADISGKGNVAAVQAAMLKYGLRTLASNGLNPESVMRGLNRLYLENSAFENVDDSFATVFFGIADASRRFLYYSNAGHEPVIVVRSDGHVDTLAPTAPLIGVFEGQHHLFKQAAVDLYQNSLFIATTDGVSEARSNDGTQFGMERLIQTAVAHRTEAEDTVAKALLAEVQAFSNARRRDDIAILVVRFL